MWQSVLQVSYLSLPYFGALETSQEDVSYREDLPSQRVRALDLSHAHHSHAANVSAALGSSRLPARSRILPSSPALAVEHDAASQPAANGHHSLGQPMGLLPSDNNAAGIPDLLKSGSAKHAQHASSARPALPKFKLPLPPDVSSHLQPGRLTAHSKAWQAAGKARTACEAFGQPSGRVVMRDWQQIPADLSAHEQWVMHRQAQHGRMSEAGDEEQWGELAVQLPKGGGGVIEQLLQQLPEGLGDITDMCTISQVTFVWQDFSNAPPRLLLQ